MYIFFRIKSVIKYCIKSKTIYLIHSPFVFSMLKTVFSKKNYFVQWEKIERLHRQLKNSKEHVELIDFGAKGKEDGSVTNIYSISKLARQSAIPKKQGRILTGIVAYFQPKTILELGTSLGFGTAYLSCEQKEGQTITIEGSPKIAKYAKKNFETLSLNNVHQVVGSFDSVLSDVLKSIEELDLVYIDGNHTFNATIRYFEQCLLYANNNTIFIFDDIHWSPEMTQAWETIKNHHRVTVTMDFYRMGCVFLRKESSKENFILKTLLI